MVSQRDTQNPDVNSIPSDSYGEHENIGPSDREDTDDIEGYEHDEDVIPVPPDQEPIAPIEEPPDTQKPPVGDVDDSPKRIAGE